MHNTNMNSDGLGGEIRGLTEDLSEYLEASRKRTIERCNRIIANDKVTRTEKDVVLRVLLFIREERTLEPEYIELGIKMDRIREKVDLMPQCIAIINNPISTSQEKRIAQRVLNYIQTNNTRDTKTYDKLLSKLGAITERQKRINPAVPAND